MSVLIDNCVVLSVKVHALFVLNGKLILITLNQQPKKGFYLFYFMRHYHLVRRSVLIESRWDCYQLPGLISSFFRRVVKISRPSVTLVFSSQIRKKAFPNFLSESYKRKKFSNQTPRCARTNMFVHAQISRTIMLCLYYYVLLISCYIFKMLLLNMFGKLTIAVLELNLWFETAVKQFEIS